MKGRTLCLQSIRYIHIFHYLMASQKVHPKAEEAPQKVHRKGAEGWMHKYKEGAQL